MRRTQGSLCVALLTVLQVVALHWRRACLALRLLPLGKHGDIRFKCGSRPCCHRYVTSMYWAYTTMTTVGYGDISSVTVAEKVLEVSS